MVCPLRFSQDKQTQISIRIMKNGKWKQEAKQGLHRFSCNTDIHVPIFPHYMTQNSKPEWSMKPSKRDHTYSKHVSDQAASVPRIKKWARNGHQTESKVWRGVQCISRLPALHPPRRSSSSLALSTTRRRSNSRLLWTAGEAETTVTGLDLARKARDSCVVYI
jgi:hypothetical protein